MRENDPPLMPLRDALFYALATEATRFMELGLGLSLVRDAFLVMMTQHGVNAVPFLSSSLASLAWPQWAWTSTLFVLGVWALRGCFCSYRATWGRIRRYEKPLHRMHEILHEPSLLSRAAVATVQSILWAIITAAVLTGPPPTLGCLRYGTTLGFSLAISVMLWAQCDYVRKRHAEEGGDVQ